MGGRLACVTALAATVLVASSAAPAQASFPGANGKIAFTGSGGAGNSVIFTIEPDGTGQQTLVSSARDPSWSPDGTRLAFTKLYDWNLDVINADGTGRAGVTVPAFFALDSDPDWSPDGSRIAFGQFVIFQKGSGSVVFSIRPDGSDERLLASGYQPAWSPDGRHVAFVHESVTFEEDEYGDVREIHDYNLRVLNLDGQPTTVLTSGPDADFNPDWSPDGTQIAFSRNSEIYVINSDGTGLRRLTAGSSPSWAPDGSQIAFSFRDLYTINVDGTGERRLTDPGDGISTSDADWQALPGPRRADYRNASKFCNAERDFFGEQSFRERYGGGANAHGKCVSSN